MAALKFRTNSARLQCFKRLDCRNAIRTYPTHFNHRLRCSGHSVYRMHPDATQRPVVRSLPTACIAGCLCINVAVALWAGIARPSLNTDFRGPWSFSGFAHHQNVALIYQAAPMQAFQHQLYPGFYSFFPFQYPPSFLLPAWWLGDLTYSAAFSLWTLAGVVALIAGSWLFFPGRLRWLAIATLLGAPASLLNGVAGETGFFTASLLLAGFGLLPSRPILAGFAFGLMTLKPQLGLLIPFALVARQDYRAMLTAGAAALSLIAVSCAVFPAGLWASWLHQMPIDQAQYLAAGRHLRLNEGVTLAANLTRIGFTPGLAWVLQGAGSLAGAAAVFFAFARAPYPLAVAALFTGAGLLAPHAYVYDTIPLAAAMLLLPDSLPLTSLWLVSYLAPFLLLTDANASFFYAIPESLLFLGIIFLALRTASHPNNGHEPVSAAKSFSGGL
jgi:multidrug transporter EmrE-like cation transporter